MYDLSLWISLIFSLLIFSLVAGDNLLARLAQYIFVGVSVGYLGALAIQHVLRPRLFTPLLAAPLAPSALALWGALLLSLLLVVAGLERLGSQNTAIEQSAPLGRSRYWLRTAGALPVALMLGVGVAVVLIGVIQGTFWPLFWQTVQSGLNWTTSLRAAMTSVLILLITTGTLLAWSVPVDTVTTDQSRWVRTLLLAWAGLGQRALWFSVGVLFARLFAGYLSLLIARLEFFFDGLQQTALSQWLTRLW
jgi:hypothetical protein